MFSLTKRKAALGAAAVVLMFAGTATASAATSKPSIALQPLDDDVVVVIAKHFEANEDLVLRAEIVGGFGEVEVNTSDRGLAVAAFRSPVGYYGKVDISAKSDTAAVSTTAKLGSAPTSSTTALPTTSSTALPVTVTQTPRPTTMPTTAPSLPPVTAAPVQGPLRYFDGTGVIANIKAANSYAALDAAVQPFEAAYGFDLAFPATNGRDDQWSWVAYPPDKNYLPWLQLEARYVVEEFAKYNPVAVKRTGFEKMTFGYSFTSNDGKHTIESPFASGRRIYVRLGMQELYDRRTIHHEYAHVMQFVDRPAYAAIERSYEAANPVGFVRTGKQQGQGEHPSNGFMDAYSTTSMVEDQANDWAYLMTTLIYPRSSQWLSTDPSLTAKVNALMPAWKTFDPNISLDYFRRVNAS